MKDPGFGWTEYRETMDFLVATLLGDAVEVDWGRVDYISGPYPWSAWLAERRWRRERRRQYTAMQALEGR